MSEIIYFPPELRQNPLANNPIEGLPNADEIKINQDDWVNFLDGFDDSDVSSSDQQSISIDYDEFTPVELFNDINLKGYQLEIEKYNQDKDPLTDRLPDEYEYEDFYYNSTDID